MRWQEFKDWLGMIGLFIGLILIILCLVAIPVVAIAALYWVFVEGLKSIIGMFQ